MLGILVSLIATSLCAVVYVRMYMRDLPTPLEKKKAALPPLLGLFAPLPSTLLVVLTGLVVTKTLGRPIMEAISSPLLSSLVSAFLSAGFPEELVKFLMLLLAIKLVKPRNVYEYGMLGAGVGFGFTALEEALYGGGNVVTAASRIPFFAMHMIFDLIMGLLLGLARYRKEKGLGGVGLRRFLALLLPILWHTLYDSATVTNPGVGMEDDGEMAVWIFYGLFAALISVVLQFVILARFRKKSAELCALTFVPPAPEAPGEDAEVSADAAQD